MGEEALADAGRADEEIGVGQPAAADEALEGFDRAFVAADA